VARGLAYLHITLQSIHRDVKSANVLLDRGCIGRIGDFGIACKMPTAAHGTYRSTGSMHGTFVYLSPEAKLGETSTKQDSFAYGVLGLEVLTGLPVCRPDDKHLHLVALYEDEIIGTAGALVRRLDIHGGSWRDEIESGTVISLHSIIDGCLEPHRRRRLEVADIIEGMEEMRRVALEAQRGHLLTNHAPTAVPSAPREVPSQYVCPISNEVMRDPVTTMDGHCYERQAIAAWLAGHDTSPLTNAKLPRKDLIPAVALRQLIEEFVQNNPGVVSPRAPPTTVGSGSGSGGSGSSSGGCGGGGRGGSISSAGGVSSSNAGSAGGDARSGSTSSAASHSGSAGRARTVHSSAAAGGAGPGHPAGSAREHFTRELPVRTTTADSGWSTVPSTRTRRSWFGSRTRFARSS